MDWHGPGFVIALVTICALGTLFSTWVRAKHGYPLENEWTGKSVNRSDPSADRQIELLTNENERLTGQIGRLEERIAVLERIVTDPADRTARAIDALR